jgi:guanylate kinase
VLEIDVEGTLEVLRRYPEAITIFVDCGSLDELERRLRARRTESEESLARRMETARRETAQAHRYQYHVINRDVDQAVGEICTILLRSTQHTPCSKP